MFPMLVILAGITGIHSVPVAVRPADDPVALFNWFLKRAADDRVARERFERQMQEMTAKLVVLEAKKAALEAQMARFRESGRLVETPRPHAVAPPPRVVEKP